MPTQQPIAAEAWWRSKHETYFAIISDRDMALTKWPRRPTVPWKKKLTVRFSKSSCQPSGLPRHSSSS